MSNPRRVLVACEYSGRVRDAFSALGWDAWSCDLLPTDSPGQHYQGDVLDILNDSWDLLIAFPPCTYLCSSGMHWTTRGLRDPQLTEDALTFVRTLLEADIPHIALENPIGAISSRIRKPDQKIQPWQFGHPESKTTCLWLKNLPQLTHTNMPEASKRSMGKSDTIGPEQIGSIPRSVEGTLQDLPRGSASHGNSVARIRIWFACECPPCPCCGEPMCPNCQDHYADCPCVGPHNAEDEGYELQEEGGILYGIKPTFPNTDDTTN